MKNIDSLGEDVEKVLGLLTTHWIDSSPEKNGEESHRNVANIPLGIVSMNIWHVSLCTLHFTDLNYFFLQN